MSVARQILAKAELLESYEAHFAFLNTQQMSAREFSSKVIEQAPADVSSGGLLWVTRRPPEELVRPDSAAARVEVLVPVATADTAVPAPPPGFMKRIGLVLGPGKPGESK